MRRLVNSDDDRSDVGGRALRKVRARTRFRTRVEMGPLLLLLLRDAVNASGGDE